MRETSSQFYFFTFFLWAIKPCSLDRQTRDDWYWLNKPNHSKSSAVHAAIISVRDIRSHSQTFTLRLQKLSFCIVCEKENTNFTNQNSISLTLDMETFVSFRDLVSSIISKMTRGRKSQARGACQSKDLLSFSGMSGKLPNLSGEMLIQKLRQSRKSAFLPQKYQNSLILSIRKPCSHILWSMRRMLHGMIPILYHNNSMHSDILVEILEDFKGLKKWQIIPCFVERNDAVQDGWFFEYAGDDDTDVGFLPRKYGRVSTAPQNGLLAVTDKFEPSISLS